MLEREYTRLPPVAVIDDYTQTNAIYLNSRLLVITINSSRKYHYLLLYNKTDGLAMAIFRAGVAPLRLETGRYDNTDEADRVCFQCADIIESEEHVILHCPLYDDLRKVMFNHAENVNPDFKNIKSEETLIFLLSNANVSIICAKTLCDILTKRRSILYENH